MREVEEALASAGDLLEARDLEESGDKQGRLLFDRNDVDRALDFYRAIKERFAKDLLMLTGGESLDSSGTSG